MLNEPVPQFIQHAERMINVIERDSKLITNPRELIDIEQRCLHCAGQITCVVEYNNGYTYHTRRILIRINILLCLLYLQHNTMIESVHSLYLQHNAMIESVHSYPLMMNLYESMINQCDEMLKVNTPGLVHAAFVQELKNALQVQVRRQSLDVID